MSTELTERRLLPWATGHIEKCYADKSQVVRHRTLKEAEAWIAAQSIIDPAGVSSGEYFIDGPEEET